MNKHFFSGVFMLSVGLLLLLFLIPYGIDTPKKIRFAALSPTYYPQIVAVILSVIGAAIIVKTVGLLQQKELMMQMKCIQMQKCVSVVFCCCLPSILSHWSFLVLF